MAGPTMGTKSCQSFARGGVLTDGGLSRLLLCGGGCGLASLPMLAVVGMPAMGGSESRPAKPFVRAMLWSPTSMRGGRPSGPEVELARSAMVFSTACCTHWRGRLRGIGVGMAWLPTVSSGGLDLALRLEVWGYTTAPSTPPMSHPHVLSSLHSVGVVAT